MDKNGNRIRLILLAIVLQVLISPFYLISQGDNCNKPNRCPNKKYPYFNCEDGGTICLDNPTSPPVMIPFDWPICIDYVRNSDNPGNVEMFYQPGVIRVFSEDEETLNASLNCALNSWHCLCNKEKEPCKCRIKLRWSKNKDDFRPNPNYVFATARRYYSRATCKVACSDQAETEILFNNSKAFHGEWKSWENKVYYTKFFYNIPEQWKNLQPFQDYNPNVISFCDVLTHEIGHIYGLAHYLKDDGTTPMCGSGNESIGIMDPYADNNRWWAFNKETAGLSDDDKCAFMKLMCPSFVYIEPSKSTANSILGFYPNPVNNNLTVIFDWDKIEKVSLELFDVFGNRILSNVITTNIGTNNFSFNDIRLVNGFYFIKISNVRKVILFKGVVVVR